MLAACQLHSDSTGNVTKPQKLFFLQDLCEPFALKSLEKARALDKIHCVLETIAKITDKMASITQSDKTCLINQIIWQSNLLP